MADDRGPEIGSAEVAKRMAVLRPHLVDGVPLAKVATDAGIPIRTARRWIARYRADGPAGLARPRRREAGKRTFPQELVELIEGMALLKPPPSIATIHRRITSLAGERGWRPPSYGSVRSIVGGIDPAMATLAHEGAAAFRDKYELVHRHRAARPNETWQADHTQLDILILDASGKEARPWLTTVVDDHSRAVAGYMVMLGAPSALNTSLALRQAIWRKADPAWPVCGIPDVLHVDHGSDFTSLHLEQATADLRIRMIYSGIARTQGRGKIERLFRTINTELLPELPGNLRNGKPASPPRMSLAELDAAIGAYIVSTYNARPHRAIGMAPVNAWRGDGWLPRMPETLAELDALLVMVAKPRTVHRDGIRFEGLRYFDPTLAAYVEEPVTIRYDPRDMGEVRVFHRNTFLCRAVSADHAGDSITLKDIQAARVAHRRRLRSEIGERKARVADFLPALVLRPARLAAPVPPPSPEPIDKPKGRRLRTYRRRLMGTARATSFIATQEHRRFTEFADAVRKHRHIGLCHGPAGVGKTLSARRYAHWDVAAETIEEWGRRGLDEAKVNAHLARSRAVFFTPTVSCSLRELRHDVPALIDRADICIDDHVRPYVEGQCKIIDNTTRYVELLIVDEAERLTMTALEWLRDLFDRREIGLILIGMPGIDKRMARYPQLFSRVGFAHHYRPLQDQELTFVLTRRWRDLGLSLDDADFTDAQAVAAIVRMTGGNFRLLHRLFVQIERILRLNELTVITEDVVEAARSTLVIGNT